jgi:hypothetical protein
VRNQIQIDVTLVRETTAAFELNVQRALGTWHGRCRHVHGEERLDPELSRQIRLDPCRADGHHAKAEVLSADTRT